MKSIKEAVESYLYDYPPALELFQKLIQIGEVYLIGGVLREYKDKQIIEELRDIDLVINVQHQEEWETLIDDYKPEKNHFEGYKFYCNGFIMDIWEVEKTWAFREKKMSFCKEEFLEQLPKTVFLNIDAIIYDLSRDEWHDDIYRKVKETGILDVVLEANPYVELNILRAMVLRRRYDMKYSEKLKQIVRRKQGLDKGLVETLYKIQENRYHKEVLSKIIIKEELEVFLQ